MKDHSVLPDVQMSSEARGIALQQVGVRDLKTLIRLQPEGSQEIQMVPGNATFSVALAAELRGTHMSRFVRLFDSWAETPLSDLNLLPLADLTARELQSGSASVGLHFPYFVRRSAPVSQESALMEYDCQLDCSVNESTARDVTPRQLMLTVGVTAANLCPCSKAISVYGAHNQRVGISARLLLNPEESYGFSWLENVLSKLEHSASSPVYPLLRRNDEKFITEKTYDNPKFVEDVVRDAALILRRIEGIIGFKLDVEAFESIHAHNAWASYSENFKLS